MRKATDIRDRSPSLRHASRPSPLPLVPFGMTLSIFFVITYTLCVVGYLVLPSAGVHGTLTLFLPWFELLTWQSFFLGLGETFLLGWYLALVFTPLYNVFVAHGRLRYRGN